MLDLSLIGCGDKSKTDTKDIMNIGDINVENNKKDMKKTKLTQSEVKVLLSKEPVNVVNIEYMIQDPELKSLYSDLLGAVVQNNSATDLKDIVIAYVGWDKNGLPVKIKSQIGTGSDSPFNWGLTLSSEIDVSDYHAMVASYATFEDETWDNPHYQSFIVSFEGKRKN